ncbi:MAG TPA: DNA polymerase III subunit epsilon [Aestuariivirgaceae bacterium]|nr:DNA polymerase III subunit epsilon [Aestuariivirgaceae bacterium]
MIREIVLDTETTGLDPAAGHRIVEIGAVELINHVPSGRTFHAYVNPERDVPAEASAVHGLSTEFLREYSCFAAIVESLEDFILADKLIIHNAQFDLGFLNAELNRLGRAALGPQRATCTLTLARQRHAMASNSLDALCKRYGIDTSRRSKHSALLDAQLLAGVYLELIGGRQASLTLAGGETAARQAVHAAGVTRARPQPLQRRLSEQEERAHAALIAALGSKALWTKWLKPPPASSG